jgi:D-alanyl-D-alanine carboxypeptidase/D-alanyl-D-alanine-endopeptidase (penicillin-binding protein 4)
MKKLQSYLIQFIGLFLVIIQFSCSSLKPFVIKKDLEKQLRKSPVFSEHFVGLCVYDPEKDLYLAEINADKYFTPASNTKILTLATWLSMGKDSIPSLLVNKDHKIIKPLGDPTFLHPDFPQQPTLDFLAAFSDTIKIQDARINLNPYGPGWAWDDFTYPYQAERSEFPMYGNVVKVVINNGTYEVYPRFFTNFISRGPKNTRQRDYNLFNLALGDYSKDTSRIEMPFITSKELLVTLLADTLKRPVQYTQQNVQDWDTIYSRPSMDVLSIMMKRSDNFLSEQLLLNAQLTNGYSVDAIFREDVKNVLFNETSKPLLWEDGSGLSRYNMFTPRSLVSILGNLHDLVGWDQIASIFPVGGVSGTIRNWYGADTPYVYAKTGTLRHNHSLSGFLITKSGKTLIFSFMNNHYPTGSSVVKVEMQKILQAIRDKY